MCFDLQAYHSAPLSHQPQNICKKSIGSFAIHPLSRDMPKSFNHLFRPQKHKNNNSANIHLFDMHVLLDNRKMTRLLPLTKIPNLDATPRRTYGPNLRISRWIEPIALGSDRDIPSGYRTQIFIALQTHHRPYEPISFQSNKQALHPHASNFTICSKRRKKAT